MSDSSASIAAITAFARAGATDHAWRLFNDGGLAARRDDPAARSLHGRLLKDRALAARGEERRRLAATAAAAYGDAARLRPATYPLINAATLALIAGDRAGAAGLADQVLARLDSGEEDDTPWWQGATRAEALLLKGETARARAALAAAHAMAPLAWEDHAVTLRQFAIVIAEQGGDAGWLDPFRPPRRLHFAGPLRLAGDEAALAADIDAIIARENIGCGFGALAAGADLLIAERLLAAGAELDVLLPGGETAFIAHSVRPFGAEARFERVLAAAASVRGVGDAAAFPLAVALADEMAMGQAVMGAEQLCTEAVQLVIGSADPRIGNHTARLADHWAAAGRRQHRLCAEAELVAGGDFAAPAGVALAALVAVALTSAGGDLGDAMAQLPGRLPLPPLPVAPLLPPLLTADGAVLAFATPGEAAAAAAALRLALISTGPVRLACHYGVVITGDVPLGPLPMEAQRLVSAAPDTGIIASEEFAAALRAGAADGWRTEFIGELRLATLAEPSRLFALKQRA